MEKLIQQNSGNYVDGGRMYKPHFSFAYVKSVKKCPKNVKKRSKASKTCPKSVKKRLKSVQKASKSVQKAAKSVKKASNCI